MNTLEEMQSTSGTEELQEEDEEQQIRLGERIVNTVLTIVLAVLAVLVGCIMLRSAGGQVVELFGKCVLQVITGSMEPSIHTGDFIIVEKTDPAQLRQYDIISYYSEQPDIRGMLVTHRIIAVNPDGTFQTNGDANPVPDELPVRPDQIIGKYTGKLRLFIWLSSFADPKKLILLLVMISVSLLALYETKTVMSLGKQVAKEKQEQKDAAHEARMREAIEREIERLRIEGLPEQEDGNDTGKADEAEDEHRDHSA